MVGGARGTITEVTWSYVKDRRVDAGDCIGPYYPYFAVLYVSCPRGNLIF
jgi:hypothetical protein